ncbi:MAG: hypothetical protein CMF73_15250 [Maricaulis sp.]|nr:hypothetical protein [Maricaulis sp.]
MLDIQKGWFWVGHNDRISVVCRDGHIVKDVEGCGPFYDILSPEGAEYRFAIFELFAIVFDRNANVVKEVDCDIITNFEIRRDRLYLTDMSGKHIKVNLP